MLGEYYGIASEFALVIGLIAASFGVAHPLAILFAKLAAYARERRLQRRASKLLIFPTPAEIKKYAVRTIESDNYHEDKLHFELLELRELARVLRHNVRATVRISFLALGFLISFITIGLRYLLLMVS